MNAERLLTHYEKIADAPDAIARLRRFILDLAVRGKLVPQDANDEPIAKRYLIKGKASNLPGNWGVLNFGKFCDIEGGNQPPKSHFIDEPREGYVQLFQIRDLGERGVPTYIPITSARSLSKEGDILIGRYGASVGKVFWAQNGAYNVAMAKFIWPHDALIANFAFLLLKSDFLQEPLAKATRSAQAGFNKGDLAAIDFPLPPLAEQHRIVAKVDELMGLCDRLEAARAGREAVRDRLAAASLARLNAPDTSVRSGKVDTGFPSDRTDKDDSSPAKVETGFASGDASENESTFQDDARFALDALPALTTRPDQIKRLRQTILNLAVRGKLVQQDANDEPALELLKRIAKEKARLIKDGKAKRQDALPEIDLDQAPFELPVGWTWGRFPEVGTFGRGKSKHRPRNDPALFDGGQHLMIQTGDVARSQGIIETHTSKYNDFGLSQSFKWPKGTLCITIAANIADSGILSFDACFPDSVVGFIPASIFENARYFEYFVRTAKANLLEFAPATAQKNINLEILTQVLIPLPPLAEQLRIVAKVDALMALCDRLEASLTATAATRRRLLDALLAEALAPVDDFSDDSIETIKQVLHA